MIENENLPLVTIITPVFNGSEYLEELIVSVESQEYPNIEHIVIDDGSNDNGATTSILQKHPLVKWWSRENKGQYATMNEGLHAAKGDILCFINADDLLNKGGVRKAANWLKEHPGFDGVYGLASYITERGEPFPIKLPFRHASIRYYPYFTQVQHCSFYISRQSLIKNNLFFDSSIQFVGDYDWFLRILNSKIRIGFVNHYLSTIRIHKNQLSSRNRPIMVQEQKEVAVRNGFGGIRFSFYLSILHFSNFYEQIRFSYKKNKFAGVHAVIHEWIFEKILPRLSRK